MDKKFYVTPEMEEIVLKNESMICTSFNGSDPTFHEEEPEGEIDP